MRQSGRTTKQIKEAPADSVFVWPVASSLFVPIGIARELGRDDLKIVSPSWLQRKNVYGVKLNVVFDHAFGIAELNDEQHACYHYIIMKGLSNKRCAMKGCQRMVSLSHVETSDCCSARCQRKYKKYLRDGGKPLPKPAQSPPSD